jgi:hypothetical protein
LEKVRSIEILRKEFSESTGKQARSANNKECPRPPQAGKKPSPNQDKRRKAKP